MLGCDGTYQAELLESFFGVWVEVFRDVSHPQQSSPVLGPRRLHLLHGQQHVADGAVQERRYFLADERQRHSHLQSIYTFNGIQPA